MQQSHHSTFWDGSSCSTCLVPLNHWLKHLVAASTWGHLLNGAWSAWSVSDSAPSIVYASLPHQSRSQLRFLQACISGLLTVINCHLPGRWTSHSGCFDWSFYCPGRWNCRQRKLWYVTPRQHRGRSAFVDHKWWFLGIHRAPRVGITFEGFPWQHFLTNLVHMMHASWCFTFFHRWLLILKGSSSFDFTLHWEKSAATALCHVSLSLQFIEQWFWQVGTGACGFWFQLTLAYDGHVGWVFRFGGFSTVGPRAGTRFDPRLCRWAQSSHWATRSGWCCMDLALEVCEMRIDELDRREFRLEVWWMWVDGVLPTLAPVTTCDGFWNLAVHATWAWGSSITFFVLEVFEKEKST